MKIGLAACATVLMFGAVTTLGQAVTYETALVPTTFPLTPGEHGALWTSELAMFNGSDQAVQLIYPNFCQITCPVLPFPLPAGATETFDFLSATIDYPGTLISIPAEFSNNITFHLRVADISREAETWGTEVPVVRQRDFLDGAAELLNVPTDSRFRDNLRIYGVDGFLGEVVHVRYLDPAQAPAGVLREEDMTLLNPFISFDPNTPQMSPSYVAVNDFQSDPVLNAVPLLRIEVTPVTPGLKFWAFVSVTNNETQHVTLITP